jgi:hypothetical protein
MVDSFDTSRRGFLVAGGLGAGGALMSGMSSVAVGTEEESPVDAGAVLGDGITFSPIHAETERPDGPPPNPAPPSRRVGFAIMGLGRLALQNILPAFSECKHAKPVALVSGSPAKMRTVAAQYGIPETACYSYADLERLKR